MTTTAQKIEEASYLWKAGVSATKIAEQIGMTKGSLDHHCRTNRDSFPARNTPWLRHKSGKSHYEARGDTMRWVTHSGAIVTLPKISCLLGKRG